MVGVFIENGKMGILWEIASIYEVRMQLNFSDIPLDYMYILEYFVYIKSLKFYG